VLVHIFHAYNAALLIMVLYKFYHCIVSYEINFCCFRALAYTTLLLFLCLFIDVHLLHHNKGYLLTYLDAYWKIRQQINLQSVSFRTGLLADKSTHQQQISLNSQTPKDYIYLCTKQNLSH